MRSAESQIQTRDILALMSSQASYYYLTIMMVPKLPKVSKDDEGYADWDAKDQMIISIPWCDGDINLEDIHVF